MTIVQLSSPDYGIDNYSKVLTIKYAGIINTFDVKVRKRFSSVVTTLSDIEFSHNEKDNTYMIKAGGFNVFYPKRDILPNATRCIIEGLTGETARIVPSSFGSLTEIFKISVITHIKAVPPTLN